MAPGIFSPKQPVFFKSGGAFCYFRIDTKGQLRTLTVKGIIIDRLGPFVHMIPDFDLKQFIIPGSRNVLGIPRSLAPTNYSSDQTLDEVFWRTILTDRWISENGEVSRLSLDSSGIPNNIPRRGWTSEQTAKHRLKNDLLCMKCSISANGRSLMVPWDAEPGDIIVVLAGGKVPYMLRKDENLLQNEEDLGGDYYQLVGEWYVVSLSLLTFQELSLTSNPNPSYVHGMMDGEALEGNLHKFQEFHLI
jgi:hypothetical protein